MDYELKRKYRLQKNLDRVVGGLPGTSTDHEFSGKKVRPFNRESGQTTTTLSNLSQFSSIRKKSRIMLL